MICVYVLFHESFSFFDGVSPDDGYSEDACSWQVVYQTTTFPLFMHLRNDGDATDLIVIRGTYSVQEAAQDFVLYNQVGSRCHDLCRFKMQCDFGWKTLVAKLCEFE